MNRQNLLLYNLLNMSNKIHLGVRVEKLDDVLNFFSKKLLELDACTNKQIEKIVSGVKQNPKNYVLCEGLAMIHTRSPKNCKNNSVFLVSFENPVFFDDTKVQILLSFTSCDKDWIDMNFYKQVAHIFSKKETIKKIIRAKSDVEVLKYLRSSLLTFQA